MLTMTSLLTVLLALAVGAVPVPAEGREAAAPAVVERTAFVMGTEAFLTVEAPDRKAALAASEAAIRAMEAAEARLSTWETGKAAGELARLNRAPVGERKALSPELARDLELARRCSAATGGAFDPAVGALLAAWKVREGGGRPSDEELRIALSGSGLEHFLLEGEPGEAARLHPGLILEEGGFGKGAGLDDAVRAMADAASRKAASRKAASRTAGTAVGPVRARLNLGGQIRVAGEGSWRVELAHPRNRRRPVLALEIEAGSVATSGDSERGLTVDGEPRSHILDPRTGAPVPSFGTLAVTAPDAFTADCLSTGLYVMGPDEALAWAEAHAGVEVVVLTEGPGGVIARASSGLAGSLKKLDSALEVRGASPAAAESLQKEGRRAAQILAD